MLTAETLPIETKWQPRCRCTLNVKPINVKCVLNVDSLNPGRHRRSISDAVATSVYSAKRCWITHIFIFLVCVSSKILAGLILTKAPPPCWRKIFHTWRRGSRATGLLTESPSRSALPIFINFHSQFFFLSEAPMFHKSRSKSLRWQEASGETTPVAARQQINSGHSKKCPACFVNWPAPRCFPAAADRETLGRGSSSTAAELCTRVAEVTLRPSVATGNRLGGGGL